MDNHNEIWTALSGGKKPTPGDEAGFVAGRAVASRMAPDVQRAGFLFSVLSSGCKATTEGWFGRKDDASLKLAEHMFNELRDFLVEQGFPAALVKRAFKAIHEVAQAQRQAG